MTVDNIRPVPKKAKAKETHSSHLILRHTHDTCKSFLDAFESVRKARGASDTPTDDEQDLLRAMLLFASAGLDSMVKQLIRDTLPKVIDKDLGAHKEFEQFATRELAMKSIDSTLNAADVKTLACIIVQDSPKHALLARLLRSLTSDSLQSAEQLLRVASHFGIIAQEVYKDLSKLRQVFDIRNRIAHEMDIDFTQRNRKRFPRRKIDMINHTNTLLVAADNFLRAVDKKVSSTSLSSPTSP